MGAHSWPTHIGVSNRDQKKLKGIIWGQVCTSGAFFLPSWQPRPHVFPNGLSVRLSEQTPSEARHTLLTLQRCKCAAQHCRVRYLPSASQEQKLFCCSFCWEKDSSRAHVVARHCSERMFSNLENECSWNCFPVFELFSVDPSVEYWSYHLITVVKDSVFCGYNWGRLSSYVLWILWLNYAIFLAIFVGSNFYFSICFFPATHLLFYPPQMVLTCLWRCNICYLILALFPFSFLLMPWGSHCQGRDALARAGVPLLRLGAMGQLRRAGPLLRACCYPWTRAPQMLKRCLRKARPTPDIFLTQRVWQCLVK